MNVSIFNGNLILGYSSVFTFLPVITIVAHEQLPFANMKSYPNNYMDAKKEFNVLYVLIWSFISVYQASIIVIISIL